MDTLQQSIERVLAEGPGDPVSGPDQRLKELVLGSPPVGPEEEQLLLQINRIEADGGSIDVPDM